MKEKRELDKVVKKLADQIKTIRRVGVLKIPSKKTARRDR